MARRYGPIWRVALRTHGQGRRGVTSTRQACGTGQEQCPGHSEIPGLDPAARSECERTDWVAQGAIAVPDCTLKEEHRGEDRTCGHTAAQ
jgi:hypothetical protein